MQDEERLRALQERAENPPSISEALAASKELVEALEPLAAEAPARYQVQLATAWKLRGVHLGLAEHQAEAEEAYATAVRLFRELVTGTDPQSLFTFAVSLIDLAEHRLKRDDGAREALEPIEEIRDLGRRLARDDADAAGDIEAQASRLHAMALHKLGDHRAAIDQAEQARTGLQRMERRDPEARVLIAENYRTLGLSLLQVNRLKDARKRLEEAAWLFRRLSKREPEIFIAEQANVTLAIAAILMGDGKKRRALGNYEAAIQLYRDAAQVNPAYQEDYRNAVTTLLNTYLDLGDDRQIDRILRKYPI